MKKRIFGLILATSFVLSSVMVANAAVGTSSKSGVITTGTVKRLELEDIYRLVNPDDRQVTVTVTKPDGSKEVELQWGKKRGTGEQVPLYTGVIKNMITQGYPQHKSGEMPKIINAQRINDLSFAIRLQFGKNASGTAIVEDYIVKVADYKSDATDSSDEKFYIVENRNPELVWSYDETIAKHGDKHAHQLNVDLDGDGKPGTNWYSLRNEDKVNGINGGSAYYFGLFKGDGEHEIIGFGIAERSKRWPDWTDRNFTQTEGCQNPKYPYNSRANYSMESSEDFYTKRIVPNSADPYEFRIADQYLAESWNSSNFAY